MVWGPPDDAAPRPTFVERLFADMIRDLPVEQPGWPDLPDVELAEDGRPLQITIVPDDYHVPDAGTAEDGRRFFLSTELFDLGTVDEPGAAYVGLFLWHPDGTFDEVLVDVVERADGGPPAQATPADADEVVAARLDTLGEYVLEPIVVEPFTTEVDGVTFGWDVGQYDDGSWYANITPGDFISYTAPWDGLEYDT